MQTAQPVQLEFDFGELPQAKQTPTPPHYDQPQNDNERLLNYQWEYKNGDKSALNAMYKLGYKIALKYINAKARKNRHIGELSYSEKEEKAHNAITYIIARYLRVQDFVIMESFTSYLYLRIQHELFYRRKVDEIVSFVDMETFYRGAKN
jgi:hypothetical protein